MHPDERSFQADIVSAPFIIGAANRRWGVAEPSCLPVGFSWPRTILWVASIHEKNDGKFFFNFDCANYPIDAVTGTLWDPTTQNELSYDKWPRLNGRGELVFRIESWQHEHHALYHPYDRKAAASHAQWKEQCPHLVWDRDHTIVDYLEELHTLLN